MGVSLICSYFDRRCHRLSIYNFLCTRTFVTGPNSNKRACEKCFVRRLLECNRLLFDENNTECLDEGLDVCIRIIFRILVAQIPRRRRKGYNFQTVHS